MSAIGDGAEVGVLENPATVLLVLSPRMASAHAKTAAADIVLVAVRRPPPAVSSVARVNLRLY